MMVVNSPLWLPKIYLKIGYKNFGVQFVGQHKNFYLISLSILITCLMENVQIS